MRIVSTIAPALACLCLHPAAAPACEVALLLAVDVSGSIDRGEYALQAKGIAAAVSDPEVAEALVLGQIALSVVQWSGAGQQEVKLPWRRMLSPQEVRAFAANAAAMTRSFSGSDTAPGDVIAFAAKQFRPVGDCKRQVIDVSGDGPENAGASTATARGDAFAQGININGIAIEDMGNSAPTTAFYRRYVITPGGFVMTARGLEDYAGTLRAKILREIAKPLG